MNGCIMKLIYNMFTHSQVKCCPTVSIPILGAISRPDNFYRFLMPALHLIRMPVPSSSSVENPRRQSRIRPQNRQSVDCAKLARGANVRCPRKFVRLSWMLERGERNLSNYSLNAMATMILANCFQVYRFSTQILFPVLRRGLEHYTYIYISLSLSLVSLSLSTYVAPRVCPSKPIPGHVQALS